MIKLRRLIALGVVGTEEGRPWSMLITEQTGRFSLVVNEDYAAFNIFGACTSCLE